MNKLILRCFCRLNPVGLRIRECIKSQTGQDLIEYALMSGFLAVTAGALMPSVSSSVSTIFSKVGSVLTQSSAASGS